MAYMYTSGYPVHNAPVELPPPPCPSHCSLRFFTPSTPLLRIFHSDSLTGWSPPVPLLYIINFSPRAGPPLPRGACWAPPRPRHRQSKSGSLVGLLWQTRFLTSAILGLRSVLECPNLISSNSFAHRLGTRNSALRLASGSVGCLWWTRAPSRTDVVNLYIRYGYGEKMQEE